MPSVLVAIDDTDAESFYVRGPGGGLLTEVTSSATKYYHYNDLGSTVLVTNGSGSATNALAYSAWGTKICGGTQKPYNFVGEYGYYSHTSGQVLDELRQLGVRYYDAETGRFTQRDPIILAESMYSYSGNRCLTAIDPSGLLLDKISPDFQGEMCVSSSCRNNKYFKNVVLIPDFGSDKGRKVIRPPKPKMKWVGPGFWDYCVEHTENCGLVDAADWPTNMRFRGMPQKPGNEYVFKIPDLADCKFTCQSKNSMPELTCSWLYGFPPRWQKE